MKPNETMEEHHARLQERYQELCRELASTNLSVTTLEKWASAINERAAVSQMLFRLDLLMTAGVVEVAIADINGMEEESLNWAEEEEEGKLLHWLLEPLPKDEKPAADEEWVEPEWIMMIRPQPEPQPVPAWLQLFPAPTDVLTQWAGEEVRP